MKKIFAPLITICALLFVTSAPSLAQTNTPPNSFSLYYSWAIPVGGYADSVWVKHYADRLDTLYATHWRNGGTAKFIRVGGANRASLTLDVSDTMSIDVVVKARTRSAGFGAASAWATIVDDSLQNTGSTASSGLVKEFSIIDSDSDLFDNLDTELMIILTDNAWTGDTQGTARRRARLNWAQ